MSRTTLVKAYAVELWLFQESTFLKALAIWLRQRLASQIYITPPRPSRSFGFDGLIMLHSPHTYLVLKFTFVKRNGDCKDQTLNQLVMEALMPCQEPTLLNTLVVN